MWDAIKEWLAHKSWWEIVGILLGIGFMLMVTFSESEFVERYWNP